MLKGRKYIDTYLATIRRHHWSAQMTIKKIINCSFQPALWLSSAEESSNLLSFFIIICALQRSIPFLLIYFLSFYISRFSFYINNLPYVRLINCHFHLFRSLASSWRRNVQSMYGIAVNWFSPIILVMKISKDSTSSCWPYVISYTDRKIVQILWHEIGNGLFLNTYRITEFTQTNIYCMHACMNVWTQYYVYAHIWTCGCVYLLNKCL